MDKTKLLNIVRKINKFMGCSIEGRFNIERFFKHKEIYKSEKNIEWITINQKMEYHKLIKARNKVTGEVKLFESELKAKQWATYENSKVETPLWGVKR